MSILKELQLIMEYRTKLYPEYDEQEYHTEITSLSTDRDVQLDKIKHYRDTDDKSRVCHAWVGKMIADRNNDSDYVVLCGMNANTIMHSFLVDKNGKNLIPIESGYDNSDIDINNPKSCKVKLNGKDVEYHYVELILLKDL